MLVGSRLDEDEAAAAWEGRPAAGHDPARAEREVRARRAVLAVAAAAWEEMEAVTADPGAGGEARAMALGYLYQSPGCTVPESRCHRRGSRPELVQADLGTWLESE